MNYRVFKKNFMLKGSIRFFLKSNFKILEYKLKSIPFHKGLIHKNFFFNHIKNLIKISIINLLSLPWKIANADKVVIVEELNIKNYQII